MEVAQNTPMDSSCEKSTAYNCAREELRANPEAKWPSSITIPPPMCVRLGKEMVSREPEEAK